MNIEYGMFTPSVFSVSEGMATEKIANKDLLARSLLHLISCRYEKARKFYIRESYVSHQIWTFIFDSACFPDVCKRKVLSQNIQEVKSLMTEIAFDNVLGWKVIWEGF